MVRSEVSKLRFLRGLPVVSGAMVSVAAACSGGAGIGPDVSLEEHPVPVAHVDIEYSRSVDFESSQVIAHFVYSRAETSARGAATLSSVLTGTRSAIPEPGRCQDASGMLAPSTAPVELLEAGTVTIHTVPKPPTPASPADGDVPASKTLDSDVSLEQVLPGARAEGDVPVDNAAEPLEEEAALQEAAPRGDAAQPLTLSLAPRAFPGLSSLASGVMYTSRDRDIPLPAGAEYQVEIEGSPQVPAMNLIGTAPAFLSGVTVGGTPIEQVSELNVGSPIDLTWDIGQTDDLIVVDVSDVQEGRALLRCSYSDGAGAGTVPWVAVLGSLSSDSRAAIRVHRLRVVETKSSSVDGARGELRFDFELTRNVEFR
jgi:hypothetical protein